MTQHRHDSARETPTLLPCLACGGEYRRVIDRPNGTYKTEICPHCTQGHMDDAQVEAWKRRKV